MKPIEIAPISKRYFTYEEASLYCLFFEHNGKKGWRLPTEDEYAHYGQIWGWYLDDDRQYAGETYMITPVRDL